MQGVAKQMNHHLLCNALILCLDVYDKRSVLCVRY